MRTYFCCLFCFLSLGTFWWSRFFVIAFGIVAFDPGDAAASERIFHQNTLTFRTASTYWFTPGDKVAFWIVTAAEEGRTFLAAFLHHFPATFGAGDIHLDGGDLFGRLALWVVGAGNKLSEPTGSRLHGFAALRAFAL